VTTKTKRSSLQTVWADDLAWARDITSADDRVDRLEDALREVDIFIAGGGFQPMDDRTELELLYDRIVLALRGEA
jgi:hypothetical protein